MRTFLEYLNDVPLAGLMLTVALGFTLGRLKWRGLSLGPAGGTLLVAIFLGAYGLSFRELYGTENPRITLGALGFALFIYSVGFEAGPRFFALVRGGDGLKIAVVAALVNVVALVVAIGIGRLLAFDGALTAGMLSGALTSAPTYAAALEASGNLAPLAVSFALTFPFGLVGVVLMVEFLPRLMRDDLAADADEEEDDRAPAKEPELRRAFRVERDTVLDKTLAELDLTHRTGCYIARIHRGPHVRIPDAETRLLAGDHVMAQGRLPELHAFEELVGPEVYDEELRTKLASPRAIRVGAKAPIDKTLAELEIIKRFHCLITRVERAGVSIEPSAELKLERDDVAFVSGPREGVRAVAHFLGRFERGKGETNIAVYAGGILLGLLIGNVHWTLLGFDFRLGMAVGLLLVGVLLGRFKRIGPFSAHVPEPARQLVRDLGILLFISETGVRAGARVLGAVDDFAVPLLVGGAAVTAGSVLVPVFVGRYLLRMRPVHVWGSVCGGLTSSAALGVIRTAADSNKPAIPYATAYAVASVLATLAGQIVVMLM